MLGTGDKCQMRLMKTIMMMLMLIRVANVLSAPRAQVFMWINPHNNCMRQILLLLHFAGEETGLEWCHYKYESKGQIFN